GGTIRRAVSGWSGRRHAFRLAFLVANREKARISRYLSVVWSCVRHRTAGGCGGLSGPKMAGKTARKPASPSSRLHFSLAGRPASPIFVITPSTDRSAVNPFNRNAALWIVIVLLLALLYSVFQGGTTRTAGNTISYSDFVHAVEQR